MSQPQQDKEARNAAIRQSYSEGVPMHILGKRYGISTPRVMQILHQGERVARPKQKRTEFTGIHLRIGVKAAIRGVAQVEKTSVSGFISRVLEEELSRRGIAILEEPVYTGEPLPLESAT